MATEVEMDDSFEGDGLEGTESAPSGQDVLEAFVESVGMVGGPSDGGPSGGETRAVVETVTPVDPITTKVMKANKRRDTKPELIVRKMLRELGYPGYRLDWGKAPGRPDIAFPGRRIAIFVNGCFWHHCPECCRDYPKRNREFWRAKIERNMARDARVQAELRGLGWSVIVIWEHELRPKTLDATRERLAAELAPLMARSPSRGRG